MFHVEHFLAGTLSLGFLLGRYRSECSTWNISGFLENRHAKQDFLPFQTGCFHLGVAPAPAV